MFIMSKIVNQNELNKPIYLSKVEASLAKNVDKIKIKLG